MFKDKSPNINLSLTVLEPQKQICIYMNLWGKRPLVAELMHAMSCSVVVIPSQWKSLMF